MSLSQSNDELPNLDSLREESRATNKSVKLYDKWTDITMIDREVVRGAFVALEGYVDNRHTFEDVASICEEAGDDYFAAYYRVLSARGVSSEKQDYLHDCKASYEDCKLILQRHCAQHGFASDKATLPHWSHARLHGFLYQRIVDVLVHVLERGEEKSKQDTEILKWLAGDCRRGCYNDHVSCLVLPSVDGQGCVADPLDDKQFSRVDKYWRCYRYPSASEALSAVKAALRRGAHISPALCIAYMALQLYKCSYDPWQTSYSYGDSDYDEPWGNEDDEGSDSDESD